MTDNVLTNVCAVNGLYGLFSAKFSSSAVTTRVVNGLTVTKEADRQVWMQGVLKYTVTITNHADNPFTGVVLTDILDPSIVELVSDSVKVNGAAKEYAYNSLTGLLTVELEDINEGGETKVTFQVERI